MSSFDKHHKMVIGLNQDTVLHLIQIEGDQFIGVQRLHHSETVGERYDRLITREQRAELVRFLLELDDEDGDES